MTPYINPSINLKLNIKSWDGKLSRGWIKLSYCYVLNFKISAHLEKIAAL